MSNPDDMPPDPVLEAYQDAIVELMATAGTVWNAREDLMEGSPGAEDVVRQLNPAFADRMWRRADEEHDPGAFCEVLRFGAWVLARVADHIEEQGPDA